MPVRLASASSWTWEIDDGQCLQARRQIRSTSSSTRTKTAAAERRPRATDKAVSERIARDIENRVALRRKRESLTSLPKRIGTMRLARLRITFPSGRPILSQEATRSSTPNASTNRVRRLATVLLGLSPSAFDPEALRTERTSTDDREARQRAMQPGPTVRL